MVATKRVAVRATAISRQAQWRAGVVAVAVILATSMRWLPQQLLSWAAQLVSTPPWLAPHRFTLGQPTHPAVQNMGRLHGLENLGHHLSAGQTAAAQPLLALSMIGRPLAILPPRWSGAQPMAATIIITTIRVITIINCSTASSALGSLPQRPRQRRRLDSGNICWPRPPAIHPCFMILWPAVTACPAR